LFWLSSYVSQLWRHNQGQNNFYCTVYYTTLNSNCEAQTGSKNLEKKMVEDRVGSQK
jgi:hypothetical protein